MQYYSYDMGGQTAPPPQYNAVYQRPRINNSRLWFVAAAPVIGLFAENYALNIYLGILVWCSAFVSVWTACFLDKRYLELLGFNTENLTPVSIVLTPIYLFRRLKLTGSRPTTAIVFCMMLGYALVFNGFTQALRQSEQSFVSQVRYNYWANVEDFSAATGLTYIGDSLETYSKECCDGGELTWSAELGDNAVYVTAVSGDENEGYDIRVDFSVEYDGYAFGDIVITGLCINGEEYEGDKLTEKLVEIINYDSEEDSRTSESQAPIPAESTAEAQTA